jgi:hypothetical protein
MQASQTSAQLFDGCVLGRKLQSLKFNLIYNFFNDAGFFYFENLIWFVVVLSAASKKNHYVVAHSIAMSWLAKKRKYG